MRIPPRTTCVGARPPSVRIEEFRGSALARSLHLVDLMVAFPQSLAHAESLARTIAEEKPELIVETGSGVSTLIVAYALQRLGRGKVVAIDHDAERAEKTRALIAQHGLTAFASVKVIS